MDPSTLITLAGNAETLSQATDAQPEMESDCRSLIGAIAAAIRDLFPAASDEASTAWRLHADHLDVVRTSCTIGQCRSQLLGTAQRIRGSFAPPASAQPAPAEPLDADHGGD